MVIALCLALAIGYTDQDQRFFDNLARERVEFETVLKSPGENLGYTTVHSETLGGAHSRALYPIGKASERYVIFMHGSGGSGGTLMYQKRRGKSAAVVWHVPLVAAKKKGRFDGTLGLYLHKLRLDVSSRAKVTSAMRRQLSAKRHFASYMYHHMMGGRAFVIKSDGSSTPTRESDDKFWITEDEKKLLRRP